MELITYPLFGVMVKVGFDAEVAYAPAGEIEPPVPAVAVMTGPPAGGTGSQRYMFKA